MHELTMTTPALRTWARTHAAGGDVVAGPDRRNSITSKLLRFRWNDALTVAVGADADGKTRINAVLDAVALFLNTPESDGDTVHLILGTGPDGAHDPAVREHLGAIGTLAAGMAAPALVGCRHCRPPRGGAERAGQPGSPVDGAG